MENFEIPAFLSHLKTYSGYPVPFIQKWIDGKPDFRVIDPERSDECVDDKLEPIAKPPLGLAKGFVFNGRRGVLQLLLCAICGKRLGEYCYFIGGPLSKANHLFSDPPMHEACADFASKVCPFVSGRKDEYSHRPIDQTVARVEEMASSVPRALPGARSQRT